jgi:hypothetical protein
MKLSIFRTFRTALLFVILGFSSLLLKAQDSSPVLEKISSKLQETSQLLPKEKVYIQTDKEIYSPEEIIWFNALIYDVSENKPSAFSQEMIVSLYDQNGNFVSGDKYLVSGGKVEADLQVPRDIPLGKYYLAAFSSVQAEAGNVAIKPIQIFRYYESDARVTFTDPGKIHTAGTASIVEMNVTDVKGKPADKFALTYELKLGSKIIGDGKIRSVSGKAVIPVQIPEKTGKEPLVLTVSHPKNLWEEKLVLKSSADEFQIKFYVEGGNLVGGFAQKVGYYVTAGNNIPVEIEADIIDAGSLLIAKTKTFSPGFGLFPFKATAGMKQQLVITSAYGKGQTFKLPSLGPGVLSLTVSKIEEQFVTIDLLMSVSTPQKLVLTATSGYTMVWAAPLEVTGTTRLKIPVTVLGKGLILLSAFDDSEKNLSSRLIYLPDKKKMDIKLQADTSEKDRVKITVQTLDDQQQPVAAKLMLSVADQMRKNESGSSMTGFSANITELINPVTYSGKSTEEAGLSGLATDYFMLCNELKDFSWDKILNNDSQKAEKELLNSIGISGTATDKKGNPVPQAKINLINNRDMKLYSATADANGKFVISGVVPVNINDFNPTVTDSNGKGNYQVAFSQALPGKVGELVKNWDNASSPQVLSGTNGPAYLAANPGLLAEPPAVKPVPSGDVRPWNDTYKTLLQTATNLLDVIRAMKPFTMMNGQIVFYGTINSFNAQSGALIVIDGQKTGTQADVLNSLSPFDVEKINISLDPAEIQRYTGLNNVGIIEITTKKGEYVPGKVSLAPAENLYQNGYRIPRKFLTPESLEGKSGKDLRTTLYWNSNLETGPSGKTVFSIPLSVIKSDFVISAEGISAEGQAGHGSQTFTVK